MTARELREKREKLIRDAGELRGPNNTFATDEKRASFLTMLADIEALGPQIEEAERIERFEQLERSVIPETQQPERPATRTTPSDGTLVRPAEIRALHDRAIHAYLRGRQLTAEERAVAYRTLSDDERRDMSTLVAADGGVLVAPDTRFYGQIVQAMKAFGRLENAGAEIIETNTGADLPIATGDDTSNTGTIVPEAASSGHASGTSPTVAQMVLHAYLYSSKVIKVSWQLIRDGALDIEAYVGGRLGERLARAQSAHMTSTGTGVGMPSALTIAATVGRQAATGNTTSIPFDDIYRTVHSVDVAYRTERCRWMGHDATILELRLAKDGNGRYLWPELGTVQAGQPGILAGYPVVVNNNMPTMAASAKTLTFGDHFYYKIRRVRGITIVRINELYIESGQVGFLAFQSADGGYLNPGQDPVKAFQQSAA